MAYRVTHDTKIEHCTEMIKGLLLMCAHVNTEWTAATLMSQLQDHMGVTSIDQDELVEIRDALLAEGFIETV